jgi:hypothetical protein
MRAHDQRSLVTGLSAVSVEASDNDFTDTGRSL